MKDMLYLTLDDDDGLIWRSNQDRPPSLGYICCNKFFDTDFQCNIYSLIHMMKKVQLFWHSQPALGMWMLYLKLFSTYISSCRPSPVITWEGSRRPKYGGFRHPVPSSIRICFLKHFEMGEGRPGCRLMGGGDRRLWTQSTGWNPWLI